jgi:hypothetical protein
VPYRIINQQTGILKQIKLSRVQGRAAAYLVRIVLSLWHLLGERFEEEFAGQILCLNEYLRMNYSIESSTYLQVWQPDLTFGLDALGFLG